MRLAALLAFGALALAALGCGGGGGGGTSSEATSTSAQAVPHKSESGRGQSSSNSGEPKRAEGSPNPTEPASPAQHHDSGGGSAQFRVKGGDNSIPEYGEEGSPSQREEAASALHGFLDARAAGDYETACSYLAPSVIKGFEALLSRSKQAQQAPRGCAAIVAGLSERVGQAALASAAKADVGSLRTDGRRGFLLYRGRRHTNYVMPMVIEGGRWKVEALEGSEIY